MGNLTMIRNVRETDFWRCVEIARQAWPDFEERPSIYHLFSKFFNTTSFVAEDTGKIRGFLLGFLSQVDSREAYIHLVAVDPAYQKQGIARALYERFFEAVRGMGRRRIRLIVNPDNFGSLEFHKRLGFQAVTQGETVAIDGVVAVKDYNGPGIHMVPFQKDL